MQYDAHKSFGYPVLSPLAEGETSEDADYLGVIFQASIRPEIKVEKEVKVAINYSLQTSLVALKEKIAEGSAAYFLHITCPATHFSKLLEVKASDDGKKSGGEWKIPAEGLRGDVFVSSFILSKKDIEIHSDRINPEFGFDTFSVSSGSVLAIRPPESFYIDKDLFRPITSLFIWRNDEELEDGEFRVDLEDDYIHIRVNLEQEKRLRKIMEQGEGPYSAFLSSIVLSAFSHMLISLKSNSSEDYEDTRWAKVLKNKYPNWHEGDSLVMAQNILKKPIKNLHRIEGD